MTTFPPLPTDPNRTDPADELRRAAERLAGLPDTPVTRAMAQLLETAASEMRGRGALEPSASAGAEAGLSPVYDHGPRPGWTAALALARAVLAGGGPDHEREAKAGIRLVLPHPMQETLEALADGAHAPDIAARYWISKNTVRDRLKRLYALLEVRDRAQAVAVGFRIGVLSGSQPEPPFLHATDIPLDELVGAREAAQISLGSMAARLGVSTTWLYRRERGEQPFPLPVLRRYAEMVGWTVRLEMPDDDRT